MAVLSPRTLSCLAVLLVLPNVCGQGCQYSPNIHISGVLILGEKKEMLCSVLAPIDYTNSQLQWTADGTLLQSTQSQSNRDSNWVTITAQHDHTVEASHNDKVFTCTANFVNSETCSTTWRSTVYKGPNTPIIQGPSAVRGGASGTWTCIVDGASGSAPAIYWRFGNRTLVPGPVNKTETTDTDTTTGLLVYKVTAEVTVSVPKDSQSLTLVCEAVQANSQLTTTASTTVLISDPPVVTVAKTDYTATEQTPLTLHCSASATPQVTSITWYKDGVTVDTSSGRFSGATPGQPSLTIRSVDKTAAGSYICQATNDIGSTDSAGIRLVVRYGPDITHRENPAGGVQNSDVIVSCVIDAVPQYTTVYWYRVDSTTGARTEISSTTDPTKYSGGTASTTSDLTIKNLVPSDEGLYQCEASNDVGKGQGDRVRVEIRYAPSAPNITYNTNGYKEGDSITLTCQATSVPAPQYSWYRGSEEIASGSILSYSSAGPEQAGQFRCEASNVVGSADSTVTVVVFYKPRAGSISNVTANKGDTVTLTCDTIAYPAPYTYRWTKDGSTIGGASSSSQTTVPVSDDDDFGRYDCVATNVEGSSDPISVFILDEGATGGSTEDTGLATSTLILIIVICIIVLIVIILLIIFLCATGRCRCMKKDNNVSPSRVAQPPPAVVPIADKPPAPAAASAPNGRVASGTAPVASSNGTSSSHVNIDEEKALTAAAVRNGTAALGHGMSISVPGGGTPRPHHLPPLGQEGVAEEAESARDDKPKKKKRRRRRPEGGGASDTGPQDDFRV